MDSKFYTEKIYKFDKVYYATILNLSFLPGFL